MKTLAKLFPLPAVQFHFAGFSFPRRVAMLPRGTRAERVEKHTNPCTGPYYMSPKPNRDGCSFYLSSDFAPKLRWSWADDVASSIRHTGWYTDKDGSGDKIRGIVMRLPKNRGFLAGHSMGERMISHVDTSTVYEDIMDAAHAADAEAERVADDACEASAMEDHGYDDEAA